MKAAAAIYTVASIAVLALMIMRSPVEVSTPAEATAPQQATPAPQPEVSAPAAVATPAQLPENKAPTPIMEIQGTPASPGNAPPPAAGTAPTTPDATSAPPEEKKNDTNTVNKPTPDANAAPDYAREQQLATGFKDSLHDGQLVTLNDGSHDFISILTPVEHPRGAAIILPGCGVSPDWQDVVHPLRTGLAEKGWTTLSLQMPVLAKEATYYDYVPLFINADKRIDAGVAYLKQKGIGPIVLVAHSCGAHMAMHWIGSKGDGEIAAYIGLGMGSTDSRQPLIKPFPLDKMKVPVLDVYGEKEYPQIIDTAPERLGMMQRAGNSNSKQLVLPAANHDFTDKGNELNAVITNWLNSLPL
jgi:hypothetical protein